MKPCAKCKTEKDNNQFSNSQFLLSCGICRLCVKNNKAEYRKNNERIAKEQAKQYYQNNKDNILTNTKIYRQENKEAVAQSKKAYFQNNKATILKQRSNYKRIRRQIDPLFKLRENISASIRQALMSDGSSKIGQSILNYLSYSILELKQHLEKQFESWMSWDNYGKYNFESWDDNNSATWAWQIDHIIPQSNLPFSNMSDANFQKCWELNNLRPLSAKQNIRDGNRRVMRPHD